MDLTRLNLFSVGFNRQAVCIILIKKVRSLLGYNMEQTTFLDMDPEFLKVLSPDRILDEHFGEFVFSHGKIKYYFWLYIFTNKDLCKNQKLIESNIDYVRTERNHADYCHVNKDWFKKRFKDYESIDIYERQYCDCEYFNTLSTLSEDHYRMERIIDYRRWDDDYDSDGNFTGYRPANPDAGKWNEGNAFEKSVLNDCAAQAIGHLVSGINYDDLAEIIRLQKCPSRTPVNVIGADKISAWLKCHTGPTMTNILDAMNHLTEDEYIWEYVSHGLTVGEIAIINQNLEKMLIGSERHVTASRNGELFDRSDPRDAEAKEVLLPKKDWWKLKGCDL